MTSTIFTCPTCNTTHSVTPVRPGGVVGERRGWLRMQSGNSTAATPSTGTETIRETVPVGTHSSHRGAGDDPIVQALVSSCAIGVGVLTFGLWKEFYFKDVLVSTVFTLVITFNVSWFILQRSTRDLLKTVYETITESSLTEDQNEEDRPGVVETLKLEILKKVGRNQNRIEYLHLPVSRANMIKIARATIEDGDTITERRWTGKGMPFKTRSDFKRFQEALITRGLAEWKGGDNRSGMILTDEGEALFDALTAAPRPDMRTPESQ